MTALIERLRSEANKHTIRLDDAFLDFDPLRKGRVSASQFQRVLSTSGFNLSPQELKSLTDQYVESGNSVYYQAFIHDIHKVFTNTFLEKDPLQDTINPQLYKRIEESLIERPNSPRISALLAAMKEVVTTQRMIVKSFFQPFDKDNDGCVTKSQFARCMPFQLKESDVELLSQYFKKPTSAPSTFLVSYRKLHQVLTEVSEESVAPPRSPKVKPLKEELNRSNQMSESVKKVFDRFVEMVHELRVPLLDFFTQFDELRKGKICESYFKTALGMLNLPLTFEDYDVLMTHYHVIAGEHLVLYDYSRLCFDVDSYVFPYDLQKNTDFEIDRISTQSIKFKGLSGSRKCVVIDDYDTSDCIDRLKREVAVKRILLKEFFRDFDRFNRGFVTVNHFGQVLSMAGLLISDREYKLLSRQFLLKNSNDLFDYVGFLSCVDPVAPKI
ncbi:hypothetical protein RCL1_000985 [Eukaryota sp. TZLM3-RCL]